MTAPPMGYSYEDEDGVTLAVVPYPHPQAADVAEVTVHGGPGCRVLREHLADVAAGLWTGAGLPAPVILERPDDPALSLSLIPGLKFTVSPGGGIDIERPGSGWLAEPAAIRRFAAALAILADKAEDGSEHDPAEVEELAQILREHGDCASLRWDAARAVLRWMKQREADHG